MAKCIKSTEYIKQTVPDVIYTHRYLIGAVLFFLGIFFEVNGSSMACWGDYVPGGEAGRVLLGGSRFIRSDEWLVSNSMLFSQYETNFPYFNSLYRANPTDMFIVYGQPVKDIAILFRPFHWGYLFLQPTKGLSFYWVGKAVALVLVSFEMGMLVTNKKKFLSFIYMLLLTFAPVVQWWFAANAFPDMLIYGQLATLLLHYYFKTESYKVRIFQGMLLILCCGAYALVFYPAWQIPFAYVFIVIAVWGGLCYRKNFCWKKDLPIIFVTLILLTMGLAYVIFKSSDTVQSVLSTTYPGARSELGGGGVSRFLLYPGNLLFALKETSIHGIVAPEWSVMFDLFPMGQILALYILLKEKRKDLLLIFLEVIWIFFVAFIVFGLNENIAKITFLNQSPISRCFAAVGYLNILILVRASSLKTQEVPLRIAAPASVLLAIGVTYLSQKYMYSTYMTGILGAIIATVLAVLFFCFFKIEKHRISKILVVLLSGVLVSSNGLVNPIRTGIYDVAQTPLGKAVNIIDAMNPGVWLAVTGDGIMGDFLGANGVMVINSTNTYPVMERWGALDTSGTNEFIYNRYAHIEVELQTEKETFFSLPVPDAFRVHLNPDDLITLSVDYILTRDTILLYDTAQVEFSQLYSGQGYSIYQVKNKT